MRDHPPKHCVYIKLVFNILRCLQFERLSAPPTGPYKLLLVTTAHNAKQLWWNNSINVQLIANQEELINQPQQEY